MPVLLNTGCRPTSTSVILFTTVLYISGPSRRDSSFCADELKLEHLTAVHLHALHRPQSIAAMDSSIFDVDEGGSSDFDPGVVSE